MALSSFSSGAVWGEQRASSQTHLIPISAPLLSAPAPCKRITSAALELCSGFTFFRTNDDNRVEYLNLLNLYWALRISNINRCTKAGSVYWFVGKSLNLLEHFSTMPTWMFLRMVTAIGLLVCLLFDWTITLVHTEFITRCKGTYSLQTCVVSGFWAIFLEKHK